MAVHGVFMRVNQPTPLSFPVPKFTYAAKKQFIVKASTNSSDGEEAGKIVFKKENDGGWKIDFSGEKPGTPLLDTINYPVHMKNLSTKDLEQLAAELRAEIVYTVAKTGGHLSSSLGVVELTVALHHVFNAPDDKIIWDVGHQAYGHKILTGRRSKMHTIRKTSGLAGFPKRDESVYDAFGAGHSSTSISAGLGMAVARDLLGKNNSVVSVIGDGAMTAGQAYEAMNNAGFLDSNLIVILNDNKQVSLPTATLDGPATPVGALSSALSKLQASPKFRQLREAAKSITKQIGPQAHEVAAKVDEYARGMLSASGSTLFEELGLYYIGPVDGHSVDDLVTIFQKVKSMPAPGPVLIHIYFAEALIKEAEVDSKVVAIHAAMGGGTGLNYFQKRFPERCFDVGIAEQHAVTFAAGLAAEGLKPFCAIYSSFLQRGYDQVVHDVDLQKLPVRFAMDRAGLVGADGPTHCGAFDVTYMACLPNMVVMAPSDEAELMHMIATAAAIDDRPSCFRFPRGNGTGVQLPPNNKGTPLEIGRGRILREGSRVAILGFGSIIQQCLGAANMLESYDVSVTIADARFCKPLDTDLIRRLAKEHQILITVEEGSIGGFGSHVSQFLSLNGILDGPLKLRSMHQMIRLKRRFYHFWEGLAKMAAHGVFMKVNHPTPLSFPVPKFNYGGKKQFTVKASANSSNGEEACKLMIKNEKDGGWKIDFSGEKPGTPLLDTINYPVHMKNLSTKDLEQLAAELRAEIVYTVAKTGGHLSSSLGVVELTVALHHVFNAPDDKIIWDVGHQTYGHKILTGRRSKMHTIRKTSGLAGFPKRDESVYDAFGVGHSSTSISAGLGMAVARDLLGKNNSVVSVIGDGAMTAGQAYEAMNNAGYLDSNLIVILNDNNQVSLPTATLDGPATPVGALSSALSKLQASSKFRKLREIAKSITKQVGPQAHEVAVKVDEYARGMLSASGSTLFEELGLYYIGPVDGHNVDDLVTIFQNLKSMPAPGPVLIHIYFAEALIKEAEVDNKVVAIHAAMGGGTGLNYFQNQFPERCFDVGIAEQHAVTFAAGLAAEGLKPFCAIYSSFLQRGFDQVVHDVDLQKLPVRFAIDRAGLVGADGPTHCGAFDVSYMACLPNMVVMAPSDEAELMHMVATAAAIDDRPSCFRFPRGNGTGVALPPNNKGIPLEIGRGRILREGSRVAILGFGSIINQCLGAANMLETYGVSATIADARFCKPLDTDLIRRLAKEHQILITVEEGSIGGFGSHVFQFLSFNGILDGPLKMRSMVLPDRYIDHGALEDQIEEAGLSSKHICGTVLSLLGRPVEALKLR
ncbi:hypothetical protein ACJIZ3_002519 [Penstemon smallii]|uniref:1-deoxy-D-xylulose-5-phosphate synthase n=1 Tax=Penstemon smallii TaxID=265156 RepID=A0ABD3U8I2_9LAMI